MPKEPKPDMKNPKLVVDFSFRREVFFVVIASVFGAGIMFVPRIIMDISIGTQYYLAWYVFARVINSEVMEFGILLHIFVATIIGITTGLVLHKTKFLDISKMSRAISYGIISGIVVFFVFYIPIQHVLLAPNLAEIISEVDPNMSLLDTHELLQKSRTTTMIDSFLTHLLWGITLGLVSSALTRKFGANYRCESCDVQFAKHKTFDRHYAVVHQKILPQRKVLILGGGFGGINVLQNIQKLFEENVDVEINIVSENNFFLFTPMLPEMSTGMIEPRHISTPIRKFCKRARFFEAEVKNIDLNEKRVIIQRALDAKESVLEYDYLVIALGSRSNFFGMNNIKEYALTIKTLQDAVKIRNQIITMLENADQENEKKQREQFLTFVVAGGGFSGVETAGEINDFVREIVSNHYKRIDISEISVVLVSAGDGILPEVGKELGRYAFDTLTKSGLKILTGTKIQDAGNNFVKLSNGIILPTHTLVWAGGISMSSVITEIDCKHDERGKIIVNKFLQIPTSESVYVLGDCAAITDITTGKQYPPTAQHSIHEAKIVSKNLASSITKNGQLKSFRYKTKGTMAKIGTKNGVGVLWGLKLKGWIAWFAWRQYYLANLPIAEKRVRVALDWLIAIFFKPDITRYENIHE